MGTCVAKTSHSCGTREGLQVYERADDDSVDGYCWACETYVRHPYGDEREVKDLPAGERKGLTAEEVAEKLADIRGLPCVDLRARRLRADCLDHFGIRIGLSEEDGKTPAFHYYPYTKDGELVAYKVRLIENKRIWTVGNHKDVDLFGWEQAIESGAKRLVIVEGECDAAALHKILDMYCKEEYRDYNPAVVSIPHGAASASKDLLRVQDKIRKHFKEVSLCFDDDEAGRRSMEECCKVMPDVTTITLPKKDANECLIKGVGKAAFKAVLWNAEKPKNTRLVFGEDLHDAAREPARYGELTWPWDHLNKITRGIRYGETIYIGAGVKMGKSELLNALGGHFIKKHDAPVFLAKPEEANKKTYKLIAGKIVGKVFHDPDREFDFEAYDRAGAVLNKKLCMVDLYQHMGWETLKGDIYAANAWGAKVVFIDPITNLTDGMNAADANVKLQEIAQELAIMALDLNMVVFIFCHLKAPEGNLTRDARQKAYENGRYMGLGNCPHEFGGDVVSNQFAGSRAMMRKCHMMLGLEGNKDPELALEVRNMRNLKLLEDREFGAAGNYGLYWDHHTQLFKEV